MTNGNKKKNDRGGREETREKDKVGIVGGRVREGTKKREIRRVRGLRNLLRDATL